MLDLKRKYADFMLVTATLKARQVPDDLTMESLVEVGGRQITDKLSKRAFFFSRYKRSERLHFATASVFFNHDDEEIVISMQWGLGATNRRKQIAPTENLLDYLNRIQLTASVDVLASYKFPRHGFKTIIPLPTRIFQHPSAQLDQLTGFRLAKFDGHTVVRSVIVESFNQRLHFQTSDTIETPLDTSLPTTLLNRSLDLISPLLVESESVRKWLEQ